MEKLFHFIGMITVIVFGTFLLLCPVVGMFVVLIIAMEYLEYQGYTAFADIGILVSGLLAQIGLSLIFLSFMTGA